MKKLAVILSVLFGCSSVQAAWTDDVTVEWVRSYSDSDEVSFVKVSDASVWEGCDSTKISKIYKLKGGGKRVFSMLLAAVASKQPVRLDAVGYDACENKYALICEVQISAGK